MVLVFRDFFYRGNRVKINRGNESARRELIRGARIVSLGFSTAGGRELDAESRPPARFSSLRERLVDRGPRIKSHEIMRRGTILDTTDYLGAGQFLEDEDQEAGGFADTMRKDSTADASKR